MRRRRPAGMLLLRLYPADWRARYGDELHALIVETSVNGRTGVRVRADLVLAAARERLHRAGLLPEGGLPERRRAGSLLVLCAWAAFVVGGGLVQKTSEHWQAALAESQRGVPTAAFDTLFVAAAAGAALVLAGAAITLPGLLAFLRSGGWPQVRRRIAIAVGTTVVAAGAVAGLAAWARNLSTAQRNGHDLRYGLGATAVALVLVACLALWTAAGVATARRLALSPSVLALEAWLAAGATAAMAVTTVAAAVWWAALASRAPAFFSDGPPGSPASPLAPQLLVALLLLLAATLVAAAGSRAALRRG